MYYKFKVVRKMKKNEERIMKEIRRMELKMSKDVVITAKKINAERRKLLEQKLPTRYQYNKTESLFNISGRQATINRHIHHRSKIGGA